MSVLAKAENLNKVFRMGSAEIHVLKNLSLEVNTGDTLAIVGASGSGKTTLLNILGGLDTPSSGKVLFMGRDINRLSASGRAEIRSCSIGFVFQAYYLLPELDVLENVVLPARSRDFADITMSEAAMKAEELLNNVGLADRLHHLPSELSGGEQQRVALARALINDPELILADEPTGNLDSVTGSGVLASLFKLVQAGGKTLIIVTHDSEVSRMCDRIVQLKDGCLAFSED